MFAGVDTRIERTKQDINKNKRTDKNHKKRRTCQGLKGTPVDGWMPGGTFTKTFNRFKSASVEL